MRSIYEIDTAVDLFEDIASAVIRHLGRDARLAYDDDEHGELAGLTYYAAETGAWIAIDRDAVEQYVRTFQRADREARADHYSLWCNDSEQFATGDTRAECLESAGWVGA